MTREGPILRLDGTVLPSLGHTIMPEFHQLCDSENPDVGPSTP